MLEKIVKPNAELAYRVLDHIDANPQDWDQADWAACFAGLSVRLSGHTIETDEFGGWISIDGDPSPTISGIAIDELRLADVKVPCWCGCAGYNRPISENLFATTATREILGERVAEIFGPRPEAHSPEPKG